MKLNVTQKILFGYIVGFILLLAFAALTYFNGKKIEATTLALAQEKIPGLIAVSSLKSHVQTQTNQLYELYATNDQAMFAQHHQNSMVAMQQDIAKLRGLAEFQTHDAALAAISVKQEAFTNQFVEIMRQPEVNWDAARSALSDFSKSAKAMDAELDVLVTTVSNQTLTRAKSSQQLTDQQMCIRDSNNALNNFMLLLSKVLKIYYKKINLYTFLRYGTSASKHCLHHRHNVARCFVHCESPVQDAAS